MPARSQGADQQAVNPFKSRTGIPTFPQCIWEVLIDHRDGLSIAAIVEELQQRGLRDVSGLKNPGGQVANNLGRHLDQFTHKDHLWGLRLYEPAAEEADIRVDSQYAAQQAGSIEDSMMHPGNSQAAAGKLPISSSKRATRSSSPVTPVADAQLVGLACTLWWDGEQEWYPGVIQSWNPANGTYTIQYDDGDQETGAAFKSYSLEQSPEGQQVVKVHEFKPGNYLLVAKCVDGSNAAPASAAKQAAADTSVLGPGDASEEDLPLSTLAERHPSQPKPDAKGSTSPAEDATVVETIDHNKAPASSKANSNTHAKARHSEAVTSSQDHSQFQAETSAAEATLAPAPQGSPEPSSAPPAAVQPRTTRSQSKRMSSDASPSISIASKQSMQAEPEGKPRSTKPPSGRRKRSLTPAHPLAAAAASPAPAEATGTITTTIKTASAGKKRQRTPDTVTGAATKKPVASRRSSRLSATALSQASSEDLHHEADNDCRPLPPEAELATVDATPADNAQSNGGVQLGSAADDEEQAAAGVLAPASDRTVPTDTTAATFTDAAPATAAGCNPAEGTAEEVFHGHIEPVEAVVAKQPHSPVLDCVGPSAEMLHQTEHPTQADEYLPGQHQGTSGAHSAAVSKTAASQEGLAPPSKGRTPIDGDNAQVAQASTTVIVSEGAGAAAAAADAADVPAHAATDAAESIPLVLVAPSMAAGERPTMGKASLLSRAAAAASITDASSTAQAANTGSAAAREEAQAPISAAAAPLVRTLAAGQAASTGLGSAAKHIDTKAGQTDKTESSASADTSGLQTFAPDAGVSAAVPSATKPPLSADALGADVVEVSHAVPAAASDTQAEAVESVFSAHARPSLASSSAPTASQVQSTESPAATAAQAPPAAAAAASATAAMLKTGSVPKPPQTSGSTRIGLPNRLSSLSKSLLGPAQQKAGSTHIRPLVSKGLTTALRPDRVVKAPNSSLSEGSTGSKRKRDVSPSPNLLEPTAEAKSRAKGSKQVSGQTRESTISPNEAKRPVQAQQPSLDVVASSPASPENPSTAIAAAAHVLPMQQSHVTTALPHGLMALGEQLPAQSPSQLPTPLSTQQLQTQQLPSQAPQQQLLQAPPQGLVSQAASQHQQLQGNISPGQQQPPRLPARVRVPLHKGVGLVRLCISAEPLKGSDRLQQDAAPLLVAKYSAWPFTCLWPESPPSQPPPLPSQSPSPPPMPPTNRDPSHRPFTTQPGRRVSQLVADGVKHVAAAPDSHKAATAVPQTAQTALRPSGKQAPKVLIEPSFVHGDGPFQPASKRQRGNLSVSSDDGRFGAHRASSRNAGENSRPESASRSASKADRSSRPHPSADPASPSKAASSHHRSHERRAPCHYSELQHAQQDNCHRTGSHRDAPYSREQDYPRSSSHDFSRQHAHDRHRDDDRSYHSSRAYDRDSGSKRRRSRSTSLSSRTSSHSRERQRHSSGRNDSRSYKQAQQPRGSYRDRDSSRDNTHQGSYHRDDRDRYSRRDRDRGSGRDRYDGSKGKQGQATHSHGSRSQRPDIIPDRRGATDPPGRDPQGMSLSPSSPSKRSQTSSMSPDAAHGASLVLPQGFRNGRIFWSSDRTFKECMDKRLFAAKDERDITDIGADTAVFLWNCFQRELHGVWVSSKQGNLEPHAFGGKFRCQARVREEYMFAKPLPIETVLPILPRIPGRPGTSFEQHLDRDQVCKVWNAFIRHNSHP